MAAWTPERLSRFAWSVVAFNLVVILWGAWVRLSGSGAGCGSHWPLCDGEFVPRAATAEKWIEYTHRATSGLALVAVVALAAAAYRSTAARHPARRAALAAVAFVLVEAALGAALVLLELVADDASLGRALMMPLHLVNTFLLLGALALVARRAVAPARPVARAAGAPAWAALLVLLALSGASGAVAALGDTLFPPASLAEGLRQDLDPAAHALVRLRVAHPVIAAVAAAATILLASKLPAERPGLPWRRAAAGLALLQVALGVVNVALLAPAALQLLHLLIADLLWISVVVAASEALRGPLRAEARAAA
jgi:cytochrome c oxidase assembly protein subunit 15